ncbi:SRPBCC domain-containing protein [Myroides pelagicus]|uniref:SRPBCC domain-containing protein n=1 Tax=Myroides pelagicus TaxID=270914 RepID=UPI002DB63AEA|nr:SRPBCC domain-containing protein [Myroides pelagicus]MEC4114354.1 SRPBCC domain-containing protein [Myroides pelagicus]
MKLYTEIKIIGTPEQIWECLTDFTSYLDWNPFIKSIKGEAKQHAKLQVQIDTMTFTPIVIEAIACVRFSWLGKLFIKGLFDGLHSFEITPLANGTCLLVQQEEFKGILVPLLAKKLKTETLAGFHAMNKALKQRVEQSE